MYDITLKDITQKNTLLLPGIIRCDKTNPCTGFDWDNVTSDGWWNFKFSPLGYISENINGKLSNVSPNPGFGSPDANFDHMMSELFNHFAEKLMELVVEQINLPFF